MNNHELAAKLAAAVFSVGCERGRPHRIEFKLGEYPDNERSGGGLCETALASVLYHALSIASVGSET